MGESRDLMKKVDNEWARCASSDAGRAVALTARAFLSLAVGCFVLGTMGSVAHAVPAVLFTFGSADDGPGEFGAIGLRGVAVDPESGDLYVVDRASYCVQCLSQSGVFVLSWYWLVRGLGGQFNEPQGVAL
jgi:hypothetical protein